MNKKEIEEKLLYERERLCVLYKMAIECGNKEPENNFMIKESLKLIKKYEKQLKDI